MWKCRQQPGHLPAGLARPFTDRVAQRRTPPRSVLSAPPFSSLPDGLSTIDPLSLSGLNPYNRVAYGQGSASYPQSDVAEYGCYQIYFRVLILVIGKGTDGNGGARRE
jgi:hypothetical protein